MQLLIDHADLKTIQQLYKSYPVVGVTTNPTILAKTGQNPYEILQEIRALIGSAQLHVQVIGQDTDTMRREGDAICRALGEETFVKIPVTAEGLRAMIQMKRDGFHVTATCIYTTQQGYLAALSGADYAAPYVNRIENLSGNGVQTAINLFTLFRVNGFSTRLLGASFKNCGQVMQLAQAGVDAATLPPDIFKQMLSIDAVDAAVQAFANDFRTVAGAQGNMLE